MSSRAKPDADRGKRQVRGRTTERWMVPRLNSELARLRIGVELKARANCHQGMMKTLHANERRPTFAEVDAAPNEQVVICNSELESLTLWHAQQGVSARLGPCIKYCNAQSLLRTGTRACEGPEARREPICT